MKATHPGLAAPKAGRELLLVFVAYRASKKEVDKLHSCLKSLPVNSGYAVAVNAYMPGEPIDALAASADLFTTSSKNLGYGRAVNNLMQKLDYTPSYICVMNTDISWEPGTFESLLSWMKNHTDAVLAVPRIVGREGDTQFLCKRHPTLLALLSRRFIPLAFKPRWLKSYDKWYAMMDHDYNKPFDVEYLSGCCMLIKGVAFQMNGGFDPRYFLYLEDADITRGLARFGRCIHLPIAEVSHQWGRGNYQSVRLLFVNLVSAWHYFTKWGLKTW